MTNMDFSSQTPAPTDALIIVSGADAAPFLNAQLTRRVDNLNENEHALAAWCNAKGRVLALFRVSRTENGYALRLPASMAAPVLQRLRMYVLRSQVQLDEAPAGTGASALDEIRQGMPEIYPETREQFLPQMLGLERLGGIDFKKGCYPGQEIVARTQYLGELKRRLFSASCNATGIAPGTAVQASAQPDSTVGSVIRAAAVADGSSLLLAVVQVEATATGMLVLDLPGRPALRELKPVDG